MERCQAVEKVSQIALDNNLECDLVDQWLCATDTGDFLNERLRTSNCLNELSEFLACEIVPLINPGAVKSNRTSEEIHDKEERLPARLPSQDFSIPSKLSEWTSEDTRSKDNLTYGNWSVKSCVADDVWPCLNEAAVVQTTTPVLEDTSMNTNFGNRCPKAPLISPDNNWNDILPSLQPPNGKIAQMFENLDGAFIDLNAFRYAVSSLIGLGTYTTVPLYECCKRPDGQVTVESFTAFWNTHLRDLDHPSKRLFRLLLLQRGVTSDRDWLEWKDFESTIEDVLHRHTGLRFLIDSPHFHDKYVETVIGRIFFRVNCRGNNSMTLKELAKSNLVDTFTRLDQVDDINEMTDYFSYEHFYVIYHKFWELNPNHDFVIGKEELRRFGDCALTECVIDRILSGIPRKLHSTTQKTMSYRDFIPFLIAVEDKKQISSIYYWFRVLDMDGVGVVSTYWLEFFFQEQEKRIQNVLNETIEFSNCIRLLNDIVNPKQYGHFRLRDLVRSKMAWLFFNIIVDVQKFASYEQRDPYYISERRMAPELSDWDCFVASEYKRYIEDDENTQPKIERPS